MTTRTSLRTEAQHVRKREAISSYERVHAVAQGLLRSNLLAIARRLTRNDVLLLATSLRTEAQHARKREAISSYERVHAVAQGLLRSNLPAVAQMLTHNDVLLQRHCEPKPSMCVRVTQSQGMKECTL